MTDAQLARLIDALDRIATALENFSLTSRSGEAATISAGNVMPKPPIKAAAPRRRTTSKTTLSRRK